MIQVKEQDLRRDKMKSIYYGNHDKFKNTTKEQRAKDLHNIICPRCKYHNHDVYIKNMKM